MALIKCKECGNEVSTEAKTCPKCGARVKPSSGCLPALAYFGGGIVVLLLVLAAIGNLVGPPASACASDWTKCADNADLVNHYDGWTSVQSRCEIAAEGEARYGTPKWPMLPFETFLPGNDYVQKGVAVAIENGAQFQNGFGAMVHAKVTCVYDLNTKQVMNVNIVPR